MTSISTGNIFFFNFSMIFHYFFNTIFSGLFFASEAVMTKIFCLSKEAWYSLLYEQAEIPIIDILFDIVGCLFIKLYNQFPEYSLFFKGFLESKCASKIIIPNSSLGILFIIPSKIGNVIEWSPPKQLV